MVMDGPSCCKEEEDCTIVGLEVDIATVTLLLVVEEEEVVVVDDDGGIPYLKCTPWM